MGRCRRLDGFRGLGGGEIGGRRAVCGCGHGGPDRGGFRGTGQDGAGPVRSGCVYAVVERSGVAAVAGLWELKMEYAGKSERLVLAKQELKTTTKRKLGM